mgnify:FL=1
MSDSDTAFLHDFRSVTSSWVRLSISKRDSKGLSATIFLFDHSDQQAEEIGQIKKHALDYLFFSFPNHLRGCKHHCISGTIHVRIYPPRKGDSTRDN